MQRTLAALLLMIAPRIADAACWHSPESPGVNFVTAQEACNDFVKKKYPNDVGATAKLNGTRSPDIYGCSELYQGRTYYIGVVDATPAQPHCYSYVSGPYRDVWVGSAIDSGKPYHGGQTLTIRDANAANCEGVFGSDLASNAAQAILLDWLGEEEPCPFLIYGPIPAGQPDCRAQVHHLIPRVDQNGCGCGENSSDNALVVSAHINQKMSNKPPPQELLNLINDVASNACALLID